jgi:hypothetical protein
MTGAYCLRRGQQWPPQPERPVTTPGGAELPNRRAMEASLRPQERFLRGR